MQIFTRLITSLSDNIITIKLLEIMWVVAQHSNYHEKKNYMFFSPSIRMSGKNINFEDKKISKSNFCKNKTLFKIEDIDINNILVSKKESYVTKNSLKYFIGYNDEDVIKPLCIKLPQMIGYVKCFDSNKTMSFKVSDNKLLKKCNRIWERVSNLLSIKFDSEPIYGDNDK